MKLLDASIVIYSLGRDHPYRLPCQAIIERLGDRPHGYAADTEMLQEVLYVFSNRQEMDTGAEAVTRLLDLFPDVIPVTGAITGTAAQLLRQPLALSVRDAIHGAVVLEHGLEGIVSADKTFDRIPGVRRYDPTELDSGG